MKLIFVLILAIVTFTTVMIAFSYGRTGREVPEAEFSEIPKYAELGDYYPLDSITAVSLTNRKGKHNLSGHELSGFKILLKNYRFSGNYALTKPGHLSCIILFTDGSDLSFYSNSESDIIISGESDHPYTFGSVKPIYFEHY